MSKLTESQGWKALQAHYDTIAPRQMRDMFAEDPDRFARFRPALAFIGAQGAKNRARHGSVPRAVFELRGAGGPLLHRRPGSLVPA